MARIITSRLLSALLVIFPFILVNAAAAQSASAPVVSQELRQNLQSNGPVRVLVELAVSAAAQSVADSDIIRDMRRAEVAQALGSVRAALLGTKHSVVREYRELPFVALEVGVEGLQTLESLQGLVIRVMEDSLNRPFLAQSVPLVQANRVWAGDFGGTPFTGNGTVVAILDSGVDKNHPFLAGKVVEEACFSSNNAGLDATSVCPGGVTQSFAPGSGNPCDAEIEGCEHGTHVAGIVAGSGSSSSGVARGAEIMAVQVFTRFDNPSFCGGSSDPCILAFNSDILAGLERIYDRRSVHNFASVNLSLGSGDNSTACDGDFRKPAIDLLRAARIATVVASGNDGFTNAIASPACISSAVSVGSTGDGSGAATQDVVSSFSNSASILSLLAPGASIRSSTPANNFADLQGTSMAAPHVAGAFALLKEAGPNLTVGQMLSALQGSGLPVRDSRNDITKPRIQVLDALFALPLNDDTAPGKIADLKAGAVTQTSATLNWTAPGDDNDTGKATSYDMRFSNSKFTDATWGTALTSVSGEPTPDAAGSPQSKTVNNLLCGRSYFFAIKTRDEAGNESVLSNIAIAKTAACNKLAVSPTKLPGAEQNVLYNSGIINVTNGAPPYKLQILTNTSADISYDPAAKSFKGTPTAAGAFKITGIASDGVGSQKKVSFVGKINNRVEITTKALRDGKANVPYKTIFKAKYGVKPYEWEVIPSGLLLGDFDFDKTTGKASLLATKPGTIDLNIKVKSLTGGTANQNLMVEFK